MRPRPNRLFRALILHHQDQPSWMSPQGGLYPQVNKGENPCSGETPRPAEPVFGRGDGEGAYVKRREQSRVVLQAPMALPVTNTYQLHNTYARMMATKQHPCNACLTRQGRQQPSCDCSLCNAVQGLPTLVTLVAHRWLPQPSESNISCEFS